MCCKCFLPCLNRCVTSCYNVWKRAAARCGAVGAAADCIEEIGLPPLLQASINQPINQSIKQNTLLCTNLKNTSRGGEGETDYQPR